MTLADLHLLCTAFVPTVSRHPASADEGENSWWPAHELGHLLTVPPICIGLPLFGMADEAADRIIESEHARRCYELAAIDVSRRLLRMCGRLDLAKDEADATDPWTRTWLHRGLVRRILRARSCSTLPTTRAGLAAKLRRRLA